MLSKKTLDWSVQQLRDALALLDRTDPDTDSYAYDLATDQVVTAARRLVAKLPEPVGTAGELVNALRDAYVYRSPHPDRCPDCTGPDQLCATHAADAQLAEQYLKALRTVTAHLQDEDGPASDETGPSQSPNVD
jgi:hypothetical protein